MDLLLIAQLLMTVLIAAGAVTCAVFVSIMGHAIGHRLLRQTAPLIMLIIGAVLIVFVWRAG